MVGLVSVRPLSLLCRQLSSCYVLMWSFSHVCTFLESLSYQDTSPIGSGPYDMASINLNSLSKGPISKYRHSGVRASIYELMWDEGGDNGAEKHRSVLNTKLEYLALYLAK